MLPLLWPLVILAGGILASPFLDTRNALALIPLAGLIALRHPKLILVAVGLGGAALGTNSSQTPPFMPDDGLPRRATLRLVTPPALEGAGFYFLADVLTVDGDSVPRGRARLGWFPDDYGSSDIFDRLELGRGDEIAALIHLRRPNTYRTPGVFDYARYLERRGVYWTGTIRSPRLIEVNQRGWHTADRARGWAVDRIARHFPGPIVRPLVLGMVLGQRRLLPSEEEQKFEEAGLVHILVVSGFNLAVVAAAALKVGRIVLIGRFQRVGSRVFALALVLGYTFLVEGEAPVLRATLMASLLLVGSVLDRGYAVANALALTAIVILVAAPWSLLDPSFQLSFGAVLAILVVGTPLTSWAFERVGPTFRALESTRIDRHLDDTVVDLRVVLRLQAEYLGLPVGWIATPIRAGCLLGEVALLTAAIQICLLPFSVETLHRLSWVSIPLNVIAAIVASLVTPLGLALLFLPTMLGSIVAWSMEFLIHLLVETVAEGLAIPGATTRVPSAPAGLWVAFALSMGLCVTAARHREARTALIGMVLTLLALGAMAIGDFSPPPPPHPTLTFLDVGQGDSTLIEIPNGRRIIVDGGGLIAGGTSEGVGFRVGEDVVSMYLFSRRIRRIDTLVLTHAHHDHMDGLFDLVENFEIGEIWLGPNPMIPRYRSLLETVYAHGIPIRHIRTGDRLAPFEVLNPERDHVVSNEVSNDDSLVLLMRWGSRTALLTGDFEGHLANAPGTVDILKVPHHGSRDTRLATQARIPVISVGANNRFGHPAPERLPALRTDLLGSIQVQLDPAGPRVRFPGLR